MGAMDKPYLSSNMIAQDFCPLPNKDIQRKIDFFFLPYAPKQERSLYMEFEEDKEAPAGEYMIKKLFNFVNHEDPRLKKHLVSSYYKMN